LEHYVRDAIFHVDPVKLTTLQSQIRETLVSAILSGQIPADAPVPSTRIMAQRLKVSRNTVTLAYQTLATDGFLTPRERSGFYVSKDLSGLPNSAKPNKVFSPKNESSAGPSGALDIASRLRIRPSAQTNIIKPENWHDYPFPFIYGQSDPALFPIAEWRECMRQAMSRKWLDAWTDDRFTVDDPMLIEQIRQRILPRRGIQANSNEILITLGAQNALYLLANLLVKPTTAVGVEDPGYPDIRNIFNLMTNDVRPLPIDVEGLVPDEKISGCELLFVTPSHQFPTNVTMSLTRRQALLAWANESDAIIIEDDYEFETNYLGQPTPALKSLDENGRVIYVGSLSKSLMPGLRMGFIVGPPELINEARALRRLMLRHPPGNNQRVVALFLALGHHDMLISKLHRAYRDRWHVMKGAMETHFPGWTQSPGFGGTSYWVAGPRDLDSVKLSERALEQGVVIEPGAIYFADPAHRANHFRLGFSSLPAERIALGIEILAKVAAAL
jgi:GntR family transcriptional regulator / MocR family aminotransferase